MYESPHLPESVIISAIRGIVLFYEFAIIYVRTY
jgi:hypothetical protein